jgi:hypothetical protein
MPPDAFEGATVLRDWALECIEAGDAPKVAAVALLIGSELASENWEYRLPKFVAAGAAAAFARRSKRAQEHGAMGGKNGGRPKAGIEDGVTDDKLRELVGRAMRNYGLSRTQAAKRVAGMNGLSLSTVLRRTRPA